MFCFVRCLISFSFRCYLNSEWNLKKNRCLIGSEKTKHNVTIETIWNVKYPGLKMCDFDVIGEKMWRVNKKIPSKCREKRDEYVIMTSTNENICFNNQSIKWNLLHFPSELHSVFNFKIHDWNVCVTQSTAKNPTHTLNTHNFHSIRYISIGTIVEKSE